MREIQNGAQIIKRIIWVANKKPLRVRYTVYKLLLNIVNFFAEFWKGVEVKSKEKEKSPELEKGIQNKDKKKSKQEQWEVSLSDDSWYRAPTFHPEVILCTYLKKWNSK